MCRTVNAKKGFGTRLFAGCACNRMSSVLGRGYATYSGNACSSPVRPIPLSRFSVTGLKIGLHLLQ